MKKILCLLLSLMFCFATPTVVSATEKYDAKSVVLMDMDSGMVLYKQNENERLSPASVTKIMSLLLILEALDKGDITLDDKITATKDAVAKGGSQIWLEEGEVMTVDQLLKAVVIASANDACTALGDYVAGSQTAFVKMMNDKAKELKLKNTHFENCTGLDDTTTNHYSSAYDLAVISGEVMKYDKIIKKYSTVWLDSLRGGKTELNNTNKLVNTYSGITGLKTGTTSNAGFCVSATASRDNLNLVAVVLGAPTSEVRFEIAGELLDYGFAEYHSVTPKVDEKKITHVKVVNGVFKELTPIVENNKSLTLKKDESDLKYKYVIKSQVTAPVTKGDKLGEIQVINGKKVVKTINLVSANSVKRVNLKMLFSHILTNI
ncbi:MAG: D-alanyl-D-alanine carboxypeptidase family protein [Eubacterium sp.]